MIQYQIEADLNADAFIAVLEASTLAERRPVGNPERIEIMLRQADLIVTARTEDGTLVGVARSISDFVYCTYLSDLAVSQSHQRQGIGIELIRQTKLAAPQANLILLSAPAAVDYYPKIGMEHHPHAFMLRKVEDLDLSKDK
jgi:predicted N-acetyltransferase YhbS